ncbi:MAG: hypothetical protein JU82_11535 [Sulfuricurvum sp. MLSB]|uniref:alkaline phosphatase D family protein n=1 Tax=unclassified Sulfuricurvum TaxID=2632390 RepID=UPI000501C19A|nr:MULTISPECIES: alkaline phosphatase D family protein [unclassified Sulfuricurvum]KFN38575.1 MAG: hypothetical protein JU82_11535 [Sulfuricurvum sp. MLSB]
MMKQYIPFHLYSIGLTVLVALTSGCVCPQPPVETDSTQADFFAPYKAAYEQATKIPLTRELIQLGLPTENSITLWYALSECATVYEPLQISILHDNDEKPVDANFIHHYTNKTHRTGRIEIGGLEPGKSYKLKVAGGGLVGRTLSASTMPLGLTESFSFLFGSCFQPYTYHYTEKTWIAPDTLASLRNLRTRAERRLQGEGPSFYLAIGDQYYVDPGAGRLFGSSPIAYLHGNNSQKLRGSLKEAPDYLGHLNRLHFALPDMDATLSALPTVMMWDDHEIRDGWGSHGDEHLQGWLDYYAAAREAFVAFQAARNPEFSAIINAGDWKPNLANVPRSAVPNANNSAEEFPVQFDWGSATFFVVDGRSDRNFKEGRGMSEKQFQLFEAWLDNSNGNGKPMVFVFAYPVPVLGSTSYIYEGLSPFPTSGRDDLRDRILPHERKRFIDKFEKHFRNNLSHKLLVLSGDVHYSGLQTIESIEDEQSCGLQTSKKSPDNRVLGYEIISSGLAQTEFNTRGARSGAVSGKLSSTLWLQDYGYYSGPSFAEIFVGPPKGDDPAPEIRLLFYPATLEGKTNLALTTDRVTTEFAPLIGSYCKNTGKGHYTDSHLRDELKRLWLKTGNSTVHSVCTEKKGSGH